MSMYYLHRAGETTGPFAPGRIAQMIAAGEISGQDLACEHGTEDWIPAEMAAASVDAPALSPRAPKRIVTSRARQRPFMYASLLIGGLGLAAVATSLFVAQLIFVPVIGTGLILIVAAIAIDRPRYLCCECGNRIEKTSAICPTCRAEVK